MKEDVVKNIAVAMRVKNISVLKLSEMVNISRPTVTKIVKTGNGTTANIELIYKALNIIK